MNDYSKYTLTINSDRSSFGTNCTQVEADAAAGKLSAMARAEFPGINVRLSSTIGCDSTPVSGPDEMVCEMISDWVQENWVSAL